MARRKPSNSEAASMDSLMDTLTNVVAILVFILIMVQINAARSVKKMFSELPNISQAQLSKIQQELAAAEAAKTELEKNLQQDPQQMAQQIKQTQDEMLALLSKKKDREAALLSKSALSKEWKSRSTELAERKAAMETLMKERDALQASLTATGQKSVEAPKEIRIPNARPVPANAERFLFMVTGNKVLFAEENQVLKTVMDEISKAESSLKPERIQQAGKDGKKYDQNKLNAHFLSRKLTTPQFSIDLPLNPPWTRMYILLKPKPEAGEPIAELEKLNSKFQTILRQMRNSRSAIAWFLVMPDSIETYLAARKIADQARIPAGWQMLAQPAHGIGLPDIAVGNLVPPPDPPATPGIRPPKATLD